MKKTMFLLLAIVCIVAVVAVAQETTKTTTTSGQAEKQFKVERGEVVYVSGNDLIIRAEDGQIHHITAREGATAMVDGKQITINDVKPGMVLQRTITTTTTPQTVTTVRTITGKVWYVNAPKTVILTLADGTNKQYRVPKDQKFMINGEEKTVFDLKKGMNVTATVITQVPQSVIEQEKAVSGKMPPPPPTPPAELVLLVEEPAPAPVQEAAKTELPKTGSLIPLFGLLGCLSLVGSFSLRLFRSISN